MFESGVTITGKGPVIVFLHSSLSSSKQWRGLTKKLDDQFTCINIDLIGYGNACAVEDDSGYNFNVEKFRIKTILNNTAPGEKYHLVGHSCGGAIALKIAVEEPENILSISLFEPVAFHLLKYSTNVKHNQLADNVRVFAENIATIENIKGAEMFLDFWNGQGFFASLPSKIKSIMAKDINKVKLDFIGILKEKYTLEDLKKIDCSCLIILGEYTQEVSKTLSNTIVDSLKVVEFNEVKAGHMAPISSPQLVEPLIERFIRNI
jgi:pimeloyl-ACP methyl ester carboxylesterase